MKEEIVFGIRVITIDANVEIAPLFTLKPVDNSLIKTVIRGFFTKNKLTRYASSDIDEILVIGVGDDFNMVYSPKIEDVWPSEFGPKNETRNYKKGGDKN